MKVKNYDKKSSCGDFSLIILHSTHFPSSRDLHPFPNACKNLVQNITGNNTSVFFLQVELPYRSKETATELRDDGELFHSRVRFHGTSVIEGIRNLATRGFATVPLPKHLTIIPNRARNCFILARPSKHNTTQSNTQRKDKENV